MSNAIVRSLLVLCITAACALAQRVSIVSATGFDGGCDVKARVEGPITIHSITWYDAGGRVLKVTAMGSEWSGSTTTVWTFTDVPHGATQCMMQTSNGPSDGGTKTPIQ